MALSRLGINLEKLQMFSASALLDSKSFLKNVFSRGAPKYSKASVKMQIY